MISGDDIYFPKEVQLFGSVRCPSRKYLRAVRSNQRSPPLSFYGLRLPSLPSHKYPTRIAVEIQKKQQQPRKRRKKPSTPRSLRSPGLSAHPDLVFVRGTASKSASWKSWISSKRLEIVEEISEEMMNGVVNGAPINNSLEKPLKIFIGYDPREDLAYEVCRYSILKRSSIPIEINPIKQSELRKNGLYWRERGKLESTEFSFTRFLTPHLANFDGWAMFVDCDFLYLEDIKELRSLLDDKYAVMCVQHDYTPKETTKMDGAVQTVYPRKNWSSMVLYNCGHPKNKVLTPEVVNTQTGAYLHRFQWLDDSEIGSIPFVWNFLVGHNKVVENDPSTYPKAIHYTLGGPWFEAWKNCEFGDLWTKESEEYQKVDKAQVE